MTARRAGAVRPARRAPERRPPVVRSAWVQPITYVLVAAALGGAVLTKELVLALAAALHLT